MGFAPIGLKVGDTYEDNGKKLRVTQVFDFGYNTEPVEDVEVKLAEMDQIDLADLPFSDEPKKRGRKKQQ